MTPSFEPLPSGELDYAAYEWMAWHLLDASRTARSRWKGDIPSSQEMNAVPLLVNFLDDDAAEVRLDAIVRLATIIERELVYADSRYQDYCTYSFDLYCSPLTFDYFQELCKAAVVCIPALVKRLGDAEEGIRQYARTALISLEAASLRGLLNGMVDASRQVRFGSAEVTKVILDSMDGSQIVLGNDVSLEAILESVRLLDDPDDIVSRTSERVLTQIAPAKKELQQIARKLIHILDNATDPGIARTLRVLARYGGGARMAASAVILLLRHNTPELRYFAACAAGEIGVSSAKNAISRLIQLLKDDYEEVAVAAATALGKGGKQSAPAVPALTVSLTQGGEELRAASAWALGRIQIDDAAVVSGLVKAFEDDDRVALQAEEALGSIGATAVPGLTEALGHGKRSVQIRCLNALARIGPAAKQATAAVIDAFSYPTQREALRCIGSIGPDAAAAVPALIQIVKNGSDREGAALALRRIGPAAVQALPALVDMLAMDDEGCHKAAAEAIAEISSNTVVQFVTSEDKRILALFEGLKLSEWIGPLRVFWCIGRLEQGALTALGNAMGVKKLSSQLRSLQNAGQLPPDLRLSQSYIIAVLERLASLFNSPPFVADVWAEDEHVPDFKVEDLHGQRQEARWTARARRAWMYVDRFLAVKGLQPQIDIPEARGDADHAP